MPAALGGQAEDRRFESGPPLDIEVVFCYVYLTLNFVCFLNHEKEGRKISCQIAVVRAVVLFVVSGR